MASTSTAPGVIHPSGWLTRVLSSPTVALCALAMSTSYGLYQVLLAGLGGFRVVLEDGFGFPARILELLETGGVTAVPGVPTFFAFLTGLRGERSFPEVRYVTNAGAGIAPEQIAAVRALFSNAAFYAMYGQTECKRATYLPPEELATRAGSVGRAIPGTEVWLVDPDGAPVRPPGEGELVVRGPHVMAGYWRDEERTAAKLRPGRYPWEQVLYTGDLFRQDAAGYLWFVGRSDDIVKSRGEKVAPREVEEVILHLPGVKEAAVVGVPDPVLGARIEAHVTLHAGARLTEREVRAHCASVLDDVAVPKRVTFHEELPRTPAGKVDKLLLGSGDG